MQWQLSLFRLRFLLSHVYFQATLTSKICLILLNMMFLQNEG